MSFRNESFLKAMISVACLIVLTITTVYAARTYLMPMIEANTAANNAYAGEIIDKKVINASSGLLVSTPMDYRLVISVPFEFDGEDRMTKKSISVDKETYQNAEIGDWFDAHSLEITKETE